MKRLFLVAALLISLARLSLANMEMDWSVTGEVVGNFNVGIGSPGSITPPLWMAQPPVNAQCNTLWTFHSIKIHTSCPYDCYVCLQGEIGFVTQDRDTPGAPWVLAASTTYGNIQNGFCCQNITLCSGTWDVGRIRPGHCPHPTTH